MGMHIYFDWQVPSELTVIKNNNRFFDTTTYPKVDERCRDIVQLIDKSTVSPDLTKVSSNVFNLPPVPLSEISAGSKTLLNILYNPTLCFDLHECGRFAMWYAIYHLSGYGILRARTLPLEFPEDCNVFYNDVQYTNIMDLLAQVEEDR